VIDADVLISTFEKGNKEQTALQARQLADRFRGNTDSLESIGSLLTHSDPNAIGIGLWIVTEVAEGDRGRELLAYLHPLLKHPHARVRFTATQAITPLLKSSDEDLVVDLIAMVMDEDPSVRMQAFIEIARLPDSVLSSPKTRSDRLLDLLRSDVDEKVLRSALASEDLRTRRLAAIGCVRKRNDDFVARMSRHITDSEICELFASRWEVRPRHRR
jgi:hypothetical protein